MQIFEQLDTPLSKRHIQTLIDDGYLPTALAVVGMIDDPNNIVTIDHSEQKTHSLPTIDIPGFASEPETGFNNINKYLALRLRQRAGILATKNSVQILEAQHLGKTFVPNTGNSHYPELHFRAHFPAIALAKHVRDESHKGRARRVVRNIDEVRNYHSDIIQLKRNVNRSHLAVSAIDLYKSHMISG
jgi:hypothetical protein